MVNEENQVKVKVLGETEGLDKIIKNLQHVKAKIDSLGLSSRTLAKYMKSEFIGVSEKSRRAVDLISGKTLKWNRVIRGAIYNTRRFKMEWLSVMFAGMALNRVFGGLIKKQFELYGVTQMMSSAWTIVLGPIMDKLVPLIYSLLDAFMNLSPTAKLFVGSFVLIGAILGKVLLILGQVFLGFVGLTKILGGSGLSGALSSVGEAIAGVSSTFLIVAGVITAVIIGIYIAWKNNFLGMRDTVKNFVNNLKGMFRGFIESIKGILQIIRGLFTGNFDLVKKGLKNFFSGLFVFWLNGFKAFFRSLIIIVKGALQVIWNVVKVIIDGLKWAWGKISGAGSWIGKKISGFIPSFQTGGIMPHTGLAYLHAGERIIPANKVGSGEINYSPVINVNANISSSYDVKKLAQDLNREFYSQFERQIKLRGTI